jgi:hypothetical protein
MVSPSLLHPEAHMTAQKSTGSANLWTLLIGCISESQRVSCRLTEFYCFKLTPIYRCYPSFNARHQPKPRRAMRRTLYGPVDANAWRLRISPVQPTVGLCLLAASTSLLPVNRVLLLRSCGNHRRGGLGRVADLAGGPEASLQIPSLLSDAGLLNR